jgi:Spy/CpxP family protein refolding chaperone
MKNRRIYLVSAGIALMLLFVIGAGLDHAKAFQQGPPMRGGQGGPPMHGGPGGPPHGPRGEMAGPPDFLFRLLNLTDQQKEQIKAFHEKAMADSKQYFDQLKPIRESLHALTESATFDEGVARNLINNENVLNTELNLIRLKTENATYNVLTAEQKAKLAELRKNMESHKPGQGPRPSR